MKRYAIHFECAGFVSLTDLGSPAMANRLANEIKANAKIFSDLVVDTEILLFETEHVRATLNRYE